MEAESELHEVGTKEEFELSLLREEVRIERRDKNRVLVFLAFLLLVFVGEHVWLVTRPSPPTIDGTTISVRLIK
jgi:hypothetical protein